jgi:exportin-1
VQHFFRLLEMINRHAFPAMLRLNAAQFKLIMDSVIWAVKHLERNIADTGLQILYDLINNVQQSDVANEFYKSVKAHALSCERVTVRANPMLTRSLSFLFFCFLLPRAYFISLLQDILGVLTDTLHKPGFRLQSMILQKLFSILDTGAITVPLWVSPSNPDLNAYANNAVYVRTFVSQLLITAFPNLTPAQVDQFVVGLFTTHKDTQPNQFKNHLRDFFVRLKEFGGEAGSEDLYLEEKRAQEAQQAQAQQQLQAQVPGLEYHGGQVRSTAVDDADDITQ